MRNTKKIWLRRLALLLVLVALTYVYLYPGSEAMFGGQTDTVMGDDTDGSTLAYTYGNLQRVWREHPSRFFYGAVYFDGTDPERGIAYWIPWIERFTVLLLSPFVAVTQLSTALVFVLMMLNAICMYLLGRYLNWSVSVSGGLGIAWAFSAFTRARAKVHMAMAGTFHLPLIFLGLYLVVRGKSKRSIGLAMVAFLLASTTVHYFVVTSLFLSPFFLLFLWLQPETRENLKRVAVRLLSAVLPAVLFLAWNYTHPIPAETPMSKAESLPQGGEYNGPGVHPFLKYYGARPIDYLGGDIALKNNPSDLNPLKEQVNQWILEHLEGSNTHERTNGIRWSILVIVLICVALSLRRPALVFQNRERLFFLIFAGFAFWLSLPPGYLFDLDGPAVWLQRLVSQVRVPSRAGIQVHFSLLMIVGLVLADKPRWAKWLLIPGIFPALILADGPPLVQNMPMAPLRPPYAELQRDKGGCGTGLYFPFVNGTEHYLIYYYFVQRLHQSDCTNLNSLSTPSRLHLMSQLFPPTAEFVNRAPMQPQVQQNLMKLAQCVPLTWIVFDESLPLAWRVDTCQKLGWQFYADSTCISTNKDRRLERYPDACF